MAITSGWASVILAAIALIGGAIAAWLRGVDAAQESRINGIRDTIKTIFAKQDIVAKELQEYKLHVAETYVGKDVMEKALRPIHDALKELRDEVRELRKGE